MAAKLRKKLNPAQLRIAVSEIEIDLYLILIRGEFILLKQLEDPLALTKEKRFTRMTEKEVLELKDQTIHYETHAHGITELRDRLNEIILYLGEADLGVYEVCIPTNLMARLRRL